MGSQKLHWFSTTQGVGALTSTLFKSQLYRNVEKAEMMYFVCSYYKCSFRLYKWNLWQNYFSMSHWKQTETTNQPQKIHNFKSFSLNIAWWKIFRWILEKALLLYGILLKDHIKILFALFPNNAIELTVQVYTLEKNV